MAKEKGEKWKKPRREDMIQIDGDIREIEGYRKGRAECAPASVVPARDGLSLNSFRPRMSSYIARPPSTCRRRPPSAVPDLLPPSQTSFRRPRTPSAFASFRSTPGSLTVTIRPLLFDNLPLTVSFVVFLFPVTRDEDDEREKPSIDKNNNAASIGGAGFEI
ncbi:Hypothetical protein NTJ_16004 [Nesidiocoris tenuis]|uniref:Uncharacterized protein n=1 Tax=Nesidiocoris tenuis TaxID=355587 RepID=A0ABN7BI56_9HEMI|nr:Hypothetical protein NTJ_16004 [Nesidiocoris tenuis]